MLVLVRQVALYWCWQHTWMSTCKIWHRQQLDVNPRFFWTVSAVPLSPIRPHSTQAGSKTRVIDDPSQLPGSCLAVTNPRQSSSQSDIDLSISLPVTPLPPPPLNGCKRTVAVAVSFVSTEHRLGLEAFVGCPCAIR